MDIEKEIQRIYSILPSIKCKRLSQESCGPILMSKAESDRIAERIVPKASGDLTCPMLSIMGNCTIYDIRPAICRIYGLTRTLSCPHGCIPDRWLTDAEAQYVLAQLNALHGGVAATG